MRYEFLLNDTDVTDRVLLGVNIKERFAEELDVGSITLSYLETGDTIAVLGRMEIIKYDNEDNIIKRYDMLITEDEVEPITKTNNLFKHELSLIELTHKLDYYLINALSFTQPLIEGTTAPFTHDYSLTAVGTAPSHYFRASTIDFPEIPKVLNRYYEGKISIPQIGQARISVPSQVDTTNIVEHIQENILLTVQIIDPDTLNVLSTVVNNHNISQSSLDLDELENGVYRFKFYIDRTFTPPRVQGEPEFNVRAERAFTFESVFALRKRYTMLDVIKRIRNTYPLERADIHTQTRIFKISQELEEKLEEIPAPQFYFNRLTSREAINNALRYVNAVSRLIENDGYELTANFFNERRGEFVFTDNVKFQKKDDQDAGNYATFNRGFLSNTIASNNTLNPSVQEMMNNYKGLRSESYQLLPENGKLMLQYDIFRLVKITARVKVRLAYGQYQTTGETTYGDVKEIIEEIDLDITPYVVEENILNLLSPIVDVFGTSGNFSDLTNTGFFRDKRNQVASYRYRSNFIDFGGTVGSIYARTKLNRVIESAITEHLSFRFGERLRLPNNQYDGNLVYRGRQDLNQLIGTFNASIDLLGKDGSPLNLTNTDYLEEIGFNVTYIAIESTVDDAHKEDTEEINKYSEKVINNNDRIINFERAAVSNYGISQRLGVPTKRYGVIKKMIDSEDVEQIGFVNNNNEVVVEKENVIYQDHELYVIETSKDFNRLAKFVAVDRQYRPTEIPQSRETLEREDIYTEYIEYSTSNENVLPRPNNTLITNNYLETFLNTLERNNNKRNDFVKGVLLRTDGFLRKYPNEEINPTLFLKKALLIPVISLGGKNNISFEFKFKSNISAGDRILENRGSGLDTVVDWWNGITTQLGQWFTNVVLGAGDYSNRPYGLWRQFVTYGDDNGEFDLMHFKFLTDYTLPTETSYFNETKSLPLVESADSSLGYFNLQDQYTVAESGNGNTFNQSIVVNKDVSEVYGFKYQVTLVPTSNDNNRDIIIGQKLTAENLLVFPFEQKQLKLYLYGDPNDRHGQFDFERANTPDTILDLNSNTFEVLTSVARPYGIEIKANLTNVNHWAIADEDGNLYLANNTNNKYVFFEPRNKRSTINYNW